MYKKLLKNNFKLQQYAHTKIPGLSGLLGKRPELYVPGEVAYILFKSKRYKYLGFIWKNFRLYYAGNWFLCSWIWGQ